MITITSGETFGIRLMTGDAAVSGSYEFRLCGGSRPIQEEFWTWDVVTELPSHS